MSEPWKAIDLAPEPPQAGAPPEQPTSEPDTQTETEWTERLKPLIGPGLVAASFLLVAPAGYGFAALAALVVAVIFYLGRRRAPTEAREREWD